MHANDHDLYVAVQELTPALLDRYPIVSATTGGSSYVALRTDKRMGGLYHRDKATEPTQPLPTLWITVTDYEDDTIARLLALVEKSNGRLADAGKGNWARVGRYKGSTSFPARVGMCPHIKSFRCPDQHFWKTSHTQPHEGRCYYLMMSKHLRRSERISRPWLGCIRLPLWPRG
jgi:hypothetical protein